MPNSPRSLRPSPDTIISVVGLGYVGLPLAVEFGKKYTTRGFDIEKDRISELKTGLDKTQEVETNELVAAEKLSFTSTLSDLRDTDVFVVTVPTPIDENNRPDLSALEAASSAIGSIIKTGDIVIYESTVYPGATEEVCVPMIEKVSGLNCNEDFFVGYSPERINPGDKKHRIHDITKVVSGSTPDTSDFIELLYGSIIGAGIHVAPTIRVAEAAKVIENTQRDINIALINEFALIFERLDIDTEAVLKAAGTKWNFLPFTPGLVGGHCIGVDPYYLTHKAQQVGYEPEVILAGRRINEGMATHISDRIIGLMEKTEIESDQARVLIMGFTFKENCPDIRNTKVWNLIKVLEPQCSSIDVYDPWVSQEDVAKSDVVFIDKPLPNNYDAIVIAVAHDSFLELGATQIRSFGKKNCILFDIKHIFEPHQCTGRL